MNYLSILNQVLVLFFVMLIGYFASKKGIIDKSMNKGLTELLLSITLPAMIISSFNFSFSREMMMNSGKLLGYSIIMYAVLILLSKPLYYKYPHNVSSVARFMTIFSNCGFMGYPVIESLYGKEGVFYTAIFNIPFNILIWTVGVTLFTGSRDFKEMKKVMLNPGIIAVALGLLLFIFSIKLPLPIISTLDMVGTITTPLSMIVIGAMLAEISLREVFSGTAIYYASFMRLLAVPVVGIIILKAFGVTGMLLGIPVLIMAMPGAANTAIISEKYGADSVFASRAVFLTTVLSITTIPFIILFL